MLSETINNLAIRFDGWSRSGGVHLDAPACAILADVLRACGDDVAQMEVLPVPSAARAGRAAGVIDFATARRDRAIRAAGGDWGAT